MRCVFAPSRSAMRGWIASMVVLIAVAAGCSSESGVVRLTVRTDLRIPAEIDLLRIYVRASSDSPTRYCTPVVREFVLASAGQLPVLVEARRGSVYDSNVYFRVEGWLGSTLVHRSERKIPFPDESSDVTETVIASCPRSGCTAAQVCEMARCEDATSGANFGVPNPGRDDAVPCSTLVDDLPDGGDVSDAADAADAADEAGSGDVDGGG